MALWQVIYSHQEHLERSIPPSLAALHSRWHTASLGVLFWFYLCCFDAVKSASLTPGAEKRKFISSISASKARWGRVVSTHPQCPQGILASSQFLSPWRPNATHPSPVQLPSLWGLTWRAQAQGRAGTSLLRVHLLPFDCESLRIVYIYFFFW